MFTDDLNFEKKIPKKRLYIKKDIFDIQRKIKFIKNEKRLSKKEIIKQNLEENDLD